MQKSSTQWNQELSRVCVFKSQAVEWTQKIRKQIDYKKIIEHKINQQSTKYLSQSMLLIVWTRLHCIKKTRFKQAFNGKVVP